MHATAAAAVLVATLMVPPLTCSLVTVLGGTTESDEVPCTTWYDRVAHGPTFRNVKDYGAVGDGRTDDSLSIQQALDAGRQNASGWRGEDPTGALVKAPAIIYLPPGTYMVSRPLVMWFYTHLIGSFACPPTLRLLDGSFNDSTSLQPMIVATPGFNQSVGAHVYWQDPGTNFGFYSQLHHLRLVLGRNPGATGVLWNVAQQTSIRDVRVDATHAAVGLDLGNSPCGLAVSCPYDKGSVKGGPRYLHTPATGGGGGTVENVTVVGGQFGIRITASQFLLRGSTVQNATQQGVTILAGQAVALLDVDVVDTPVGLYVHGAQAISVLDSRFRGHTSSAVEIQDASALVLERVNVSGTRWAVEGLLPTDNATQSVEVDSWFRGPFAYYNHTQLASDSGRLTPQRMQEITTLRRPTFGPTIVSIRDHGGVGDGITDDTQALQSAIATAATISGSAAVFLPFGWYRLTDTVRLTPTSTLVGEGLSHIFLAANSTGFNNPLTPKAVLATPDDADANITLADLMLFSAEGNTGAILLDWRCGVRSAIFDVNFRIFHPVGELFHIAGNGGGLVDNMWGWTAGNNQSLRQHVSVDNHVGVNITGTSQPLWMLCTQFEHHTKVSYNIEHVSNAVFVFVQTEQISWLTPRGPNALAFQVQNSSNILGYSLYFGDPVPAPLVAHELVSVSGSRNISLYAVVEACGPRKKDGKTNEGCTGRVIGGDRVLAGGKMPSGFVGLTVAELI